MRRHSVALVAVPAAGRRHAPRARHPIPMLARNIAASCANCHGTNGVSQGGVPSLAGQSKADLVRKMQDFKTGKTPGDDHAAARQGLHRRADRPRRRLVRRAEAVTADEGSRSMTHATA